MPRFTRCFSAYCPELVGTAVFHVKDVWHVVSSPLSSYEVHHAFHKHKIGSSSLYDHGMNEDTHPSHPGTVTASKSRLQHNLWDLPQHRLVHECLSHRLDEFLEVRELVIAIRDASAAHGEAATLADTLHPDICPRNIKIQRDQDGQSRGCLIDWDHSTNIPQLERRSTWQFTAVRLLSDEQLVPIQNRIDGVESFFHLLTWMALRYTTHGMKSSRLTFSLRYNFDSFYWDPEKGGLYATSFRTAGGLWQLDDLIRQARLGNEGIHSVLQEMRLVLHERYTRPQALYSHVRDLNSDPLRMKEVEIGQRVKEWALESLDDPRWLPNLLQKFLEDEKIDWEVNKDRMENELPRLQYLAGRNPSIRFLC